MNLNVAVRVLVNKNMFSHKLLLLFQEAKIKSGNTEMLYMEEHSNDHDTDTWLQSMLWMFPVSQ